ncbi:MAG: hypothetical protein ACJ786_20470 [Catenulispora sp.]
MSNDLSRAMRATAEDLHPNVGKLTSGGIERGVHKRRTRRITQIAGAAASVTAVFGVVAMVAPGSRADGSGAHVSAASGLVPAAVSTTTSAPAKPSAPPVSGEDMVKWLEQALAPYHFSDVSVEYKAGSAEFGGPYAVLQLGYSSGVGSLALNVSRSAWSDQTVDGTPPYITTKTLSDGSHLEIFDGPEWPAGNGDPKAKRLDVGWYRTDGTLVDVMVLNQAREKEAVTATGMALTVDQATQLVQSPVWNQAIAAVLATPRPGSAPGGTPADKAADLRAKNAGPNGGTPASPAAPPAH